jgi:formate hydrogenlyase subunit 3/multisubunit Na+/H+ antiporter MnhD subunit
VDASESEVVVTVTYNGSPTEFIIVGFIAILVSPILGRVYARVSYKIFGAIRRKRTEPRPAVDSRRYTLAIAFLGIVFVVLGIYRTLG